MLKRPVAFGDDSPSKFESIYYFARDTIDSFPFSRYSLFETSQSLFWASFGLVDLMAFELQGIKSFTRFWAMLMFGSYSVINIIVLLNMLIAMMSNSYQIISVSKMSQMHETALGCALCVLMTICPCACAIERSIAFQTYRNDLIRNGSSPVRNCGWAILKMVAHYRLRSIWHRLQNSFVAAKQRNQRKVPL